MSTIEIPTIEPSSDEHPHHVLVDGVERSPRWRRWGQVPPAGSVVDLVPSLHPERLNVVDDLTLELVGSIPRDHCPTPLSSRSGLSGVVVSSTQGPRPVVVIAFPDDDDGPAAA